MSFAQTGRPQLAGRAMPAPRMARKMRRPQHSAHLHFLPHYLVPFMAAPVLPGETLKNALFQSRVLTTPIRNQVSGWWIEHYFFYVKHRHLASAQEYVDIMLDLGAGLTAETNSAAWFQQIGTVSSSIVREAYEVVVNHFFRGEGEEVSIPDSASNQLVKAKLRMPGWWDSIIPDTQLTTGMGGIADDSIGAGTALDQVGEVGKALETWQQLRMLGITNMEYEDYLRSFGVSVAAPREDVPELLRYTREWQYPSSTVLSSTVEETAQRVSAVVSWSITERIDKDRYFKEPGILLGIVLVRPKTYLNSGVAGIGLLKNGLGWLGPTAMGASPYDVYQSMGALSPGESFDPRDLFLHGDHWWYTQAGGTPTAPNIAFPTDGVFDVASDAHIETLFYDGADGHVKMDATVNLGIASQVLGDDVTPRTVGA